MQTFVLKHKKIKNIIRTHTNFKLIKISNHSVVVLLQTFGDCLDGSSPPWVKIFLFFFAFFNYFFDFYYMVIEGPLAPNFFMYTLYWPLLSFYVKIIKNWDLHLVSVPCQWVYSK